MKRQNLGSMSLVLLTMLSIACSNNENNGPNNIYIPPIDDETNDVVKDVLGDQGDETQDTDGQKDQSTDGDKDDDTDMPQGTGVCTNIIDMGTMDASAGTITLNGDTTGATTNGVSSSCGNGAAMEQVFALKFDAPVRVTAKLGDNANGVPWGFSLRRGTCDTNEEIVCTPNTSNFFFNILADETYYFVVEPTSGASKGAFTVDLELTELVCLPIASRTCATDAGVDGINFCTGGGTREDFFACPTSEGGACTSAEDSCGGDKCENIIEIAATSGTSYSLTAPYKSYTNSFTFKDATTCKSPDNAVLVEGVPDLENSPPFKLDTPGNDVAIKLTGMIAGQKVNVDASTEIGDTGDSAIFIMTGCDVSTCVYGVDLSDKIEGWEVPADGDYTVVVDRLGGNDTDLSLKIDID